MHYLIFVMFSTPIYENYVLNVNISVFYKTVYQISWISKVAGLKIFTLQKYVFDNVYYNSQVNSSTWPGLILRTYLIRHKYFHLFEKKPTRDESKIFLHVWIIRSYFLNVIQCIYFLIKQIIIWICITVIQWLHGTSPYPFFFFCQTLVSLKRHT